MSQGMEDDGMEDIQSESQADQQASQVASQTEAAPKPTKNVKDPCIYCGKNCKGGSIQCTICTLWCHRQCMGLSKEAIKGIELQAKEVGVAYWACRACMNFNKKVNHQLRVTEQRQDETDKKVAENTAQIEVVRKIAEEARKEARAQVEKMAQLEEKVERTVDDELREREARRLNLVIHGVPEVSDTVVNNRERMERDKKEVERLMIQIKVNTRAQDIRFCRRIGERGRVPRPIVIGLHTEGERAAILNKARDLMGSIYEEVSIVPDLTQNQRRGEQRLRDEAGKRNEQLTEEDRRKNLKWIVVGRRGEKRLIKGVERENQTGREDRRTNSGHGGNRGIERENQTGREERRTNGGHGENRGWGQDRQGGGQPSRGGGQDNRFNRDILPNSRDREVTNWIPQNDRPSSETGTRRREASSGLNSENTQPRDTDRQERQTAQPQEVEDRWPPLDRAGQRNRGLERNQEGRWDSEADYRRDRLNSKRGRSAGVNEEYEEENPPQRNRY